MIPQGERSYTASWENGAGKDERSVNGSLILNQFYLGVERKAPKAALDVIRRIDNAIRYAQEFPDAGGHFRMDELANEYRTALANPYTVYYRRSDTTLTVYRILHQRQNIDTYTLIDF